MSDLRDHLFASLERLNDESLTPELLKDELAKSKQIAHIGSVLVNSAKVEIDYLKVTGQVDSTSELFKSMNPQKQIS